MGICFGSGLIEEKKKAELGEELGVENYTCKAWYDALNSEDNFKCTWKDGLCKVSTDPTTFYGMIFE